MASSETIMLVIIVIGVSLYLWKFKKTSKPKGFPPSWRPSLNKWVGFYRNLNGSGKVLFEDKMMHFLSYVKITPVRCKVEALDIILISASAVIPMYNFKNWEYRNLNEVILYPNSFNQEFETNGEGRNMLGLVGNTGPLKHKMILSQRSLRNGFQQKDKKNVGIHEFIHLLDMTDGQIDGVPEVILQQSYIIPWINLMHEEMKKISSGNSTIRIYGATNQGEFFSVVSEYFFGQPRLLKKKHPKLYVMLNKMYGNSPQ